MAYRVKLRETPAQALTRIGEEELARARKQLMSARSNGRAGEAIHSARRALKRFRALLALCEPLIGKKKCRSQRRSAASAARLLASTRDFQVMRESVQSLLDRAAISEAAGEFLISALDRAAPTRRVRGTAPDPVRKALLAVSNLVDSLPSSRTKGRRKVLVVGMRRTYKRCLTAQSTAWAEKTDDAFHDFRKHVQTHWRHLQLMRRAWSEEMGARIELARSLSQLLGEDHDLAVLATFASAISDPTPALQAEVMAACRARQKIIRRLARPLARRLFAESPSDFARRISIYWATERKIMHLAHSRPVEHRDGSEELTA